VKKDEGPRKVREALAKYLEKAGISEKIEAASVVPDWPRLVGDGIAGVTTPLKVSNGVLFVGVRSSAWLSELKLMEREIIKRVNAERTRGKITGIRFVMQ
jgi:predicted nucleic acid-binding Zn ribbon protein